MVVTSARYSIRLQHSTRITLTAECDSFPHTAIITWKATGSINWSIGIGGNWQNMKERGRAGEGGGGECTYDILVTGCNNQWAVSGMLPIAAGNQSARFSFSVANYSLKLHKKDSIRAALHGIRQFH